MASRRTGRSRYIQFGRDEWASLRAATPLPLDEEELKQLRGLNEQVSLQEVEEVYLPLSRLLNLYATATQELFEVTDRFLGKPAGKVPYVIAIAGSVAVGKSTTARVLRALLARWPHHPKVDLITTDGFLFSNELLERRGLLERKGFPESYDRRRLVQFLSDVKSGRAEVRAPVYSHQAYDIVPDRHQTVRSPDLVILEGLNVLQTGAAPQAATTGTLFVSDLIDFSIYVDADEADIEHWYAERFLTLRDTVFRDPASYFHRYAHLTRDEAVTTARDIWERINGVNLRENILPTRERAHLILRKGRDHSVCEVRLRKI